MINLLLITLILHYLNIFRLGKTRDKSIAFCGIFGMATKEPKFISSPNLKILGMMNESRGRTCCGITVDGEIYHGHDKEKLFTDFAKGRSFAAKQVPVVIGHTRQASTGMAINKHNAHPFGFGELNGGYAFVGVHNGTLLNHKELAEKYEIETTVQVPSEYNPTMTIPRTKIDSEIILEIIYKTKTLKVLSEYNGRAALVWQDLNEPNVVYLYSGKSVPDEGDDETKAVEERPMHVWIAGRNNFYFSSMPESLEILGATTEDVFQIEYNTVHIVKNGDFNNARKIRISRKGNYHTESWGNYGRLSNYSKHWGNTSSIAKGNEEAAKTGASGTQTKIDLNAGITGTKIIRPSFHIFDDETDLPEATYKSKVYTKKLRYYRNGHLITGIYTYIKGYGFMYLGEEYKECEKAVQWMVDMPFNIQTNEFDIDSVWKPFKSINDIYFYYFIEGVMVESILDYKMFLQYSKNKMDYYMTAEKLSHVSKYPVFNVNTRHTVLTQGVYHEGKPFTGNFRGIDQYKVYYFNNGNLVKTKNINGDIIASSEKYVSKTDVDKDIYDNTVYVKTECWGKVSSSVFEKEPAAKVIELPASNVKTEVKDTYNATLLETVSKHLTNHEKLYMEKKALTEEPTSCEILVDAVDSVDEYLCEIVTERIVEIDSIVCELREEMRGFKENVLYNSIISDVNQISKIVNNYIK